MPIATGFAANWSPTGTTGFSTIWNPIPWVDGDYTFSLPTPAPCPYLTGLPMVKLAPVSPWTSTLKNSSRNALAGYEYQTRITSETDWQSTEKTALLFCCQN